MKNKYEKLKHKSKLEKKVVVFIEQASYEV